MVWFRSSVVLCVVLVGVLPAQAEGHLDEPIVVIGGKLGGGLGGPLNEFGATPIGELELGLLLPFPEPVGKSFELFVSGAYAQPGIEDSAGMPDPRLPADGILHYEVTEREAAVTAGLLYRLQLGPVAPYAAAGARMYLLETEVKGSAGGESFGTNTETDVEFGAHFALGLDIFLGPGALLAELQLPFAGVDGFILRDTNLGSMNLLVGYRLMLPAGGEPVPEERAGEAPAEAEISESVEEPPPASAEQTVEEFTEPEPPPEAETPPVEAADEAEAAPVEAAAVETAPAAAPADDGPPPGKGQIRGHIRSFSGQGLRASARVYPLGAKASANADGYFELNVPPGRYTVRLRAFGHRSQNRTVMVSEDGITVLNVELRKK